MRSLPTLVTTAALLIAAHATFAADTAEVVLNDGAGEIVGTVVGAATEPASGSGLTDENVLWVVRPIGDTPVLLLVDHDALRDTKGLVPFFYQSSDCTGPAFLEAPAESDEYAAAVIFDTSVFWPAARGTSRVVRSRGTLVRQSVDCTETLVAPHFCCATVSGGETRVTAPFTSINIAELHLRAPFRFEQGMPHGE